VDIEAIAEFDPGLNIFPFPNLQETFDLEGFISGDLNVIDVDEWIYYQRPARYRFTLAHEIRHDVFLIKQFTGSDPALRKCQFSTMSPRPPVPRFLFAHDERYLCCGVALEGRLWRLFQELLDML
jgi:hypothetical protein